jgi:hypothetical protein
MSATFEPREVEKPFRMRWLRMTLQLMLRSPVRFSIAILLLGCLDNSAVSLFAGVRVAGTWLTRLGMLMLPSVWVFIAALARGADNPSQTWKAFAGFARLKVWMGVLAIGAGLVALEWTVRLLLGNPASRGHQVNPGRFLEFTGAQAWMVYAAVDICFFPLLLFEPELSLREARQLSKNASNINGWRIISGLMAAMLAVAVIIQLSVPAYGMTSAAWIVFMGVLNYVAYRDIFERRSANWPAVVTAPIVARESRASR